MTTLTTRPSRIRWLILALLFLISVVTYIDRVNISVTARQMMPAYGMTDQEMGWVFSAFVVGIFSSLNKRFIGAGSALAVTGLQMGTGALLLPLVGWALANDTVLVAPGLRDALLLVTLSMACTLLPYSLALVALRHLSAFATTLAVNMEPVYAIVLAVLLLGEQRDLTPGFYFGVALIMAVVFTHWWASRRAAPAPAPAA